MDMERLKATAIDAALSRIAQAIEPGITGAEIQKRSALEVFSGGYTWLFDGKPKAIVEFTADSRFEITLYHR